MADATAEDVTRIGKYLYALETAPAKGRKTKTWYVYNNDHIGVGKVSWRSGWRCYVFVPGEDTVFHDGCLHDIAKFLTSVKKERNT